MKLESLISELDVRRVGGDLEQVEISHITDNSRDVTPGSLFIARSGVSADGRAWIADAIAFRAAAILTDEQGLEIAQQEMTATDHQPVLICSDGNLRELTAQIAERFHGNPGDQLKLIGVTGSNGKTTVAWLIRQLCAHAGIRCGLISTVETIAGDERRQAVMTTPPAPMISGLLAKMVEAGDQACAMEVSSHALDQSRTGALNFDIAVFTNLTGDHLDYHGDMDSYASAKARLFESLGESALAVVNADDQAHERMVAGSPATICRCSTGAGDASVILSDSTIDGCRLVLSGAWGSIDAIVPLIGAHNAMNTLQAVVCAHHLGAARDAIEKALAMLTAPPGRLERVMSPADLEAPAVVVDYAHTDDALEQTCTALRALLPTGGKLRLVFGCGGDRDTTKRPRMGAVAARLADVCYVTSDNPRTEPPRAIIDEIMAGIPSKPRKDPSRCVPIVHRREAIEMAIIDASPSDIVCIAGKGHERTQIIPDGRGGTIKLPFHDVSVASESMAARAQERMA